MRIDKYISREKWISRNKAQMLLQDRSVSVNGRLVMKSSFVVDTEVDVVSISQNDKADYVSRSAIKLKLFLEQIDITIENKVCLDIWASTGWFTQILDENKAKIIYSLDVGTSQLDQKLRWKANILSIENTDIRDYSSQEILDIITCDVSFISLTKIIDSIFSLSSRETKIILLYKPQFEVWKDNLTKQNLPKNQKIVDRHLNDFCQLLRDKWCKIHKVEISALEWEAGNKEYFIWCTLTS